MSLKLLRNWRSSCVSSSQGGRRQLLTAAMALVISIGRSYYSRSASVHVRCNMTLLYYFPRWNNALCLHCCPSGRSRSCASPAGRCITAAKNWPKMNLYIAFDDGSQQSNYLGEMSVRLFRQNMWCMFLLPFLVMKKKVQDPEEFLAIIRNICIAKLLYLMKLSRKTRKLSICCWRSTVEAT